MTDATDKSQTVAATLRAVAAAIDEGQPITSGTFLASLADVLDGTVSLDDADDEPNVEHELPTFSELLAGRYPTTILAETPVIQDMPIPGEHPDPQAALADLWLEGRGVRTQLPAAEELPIPSGPPSKVVTLELAQGMPVPGDTIRPALQLMAEPMPRPRSVRVAVHREGRERVRARSSGSRVKENSHAVSTERDPSPRALGEVGGEVPRPGTGEPQVVHRGVGDVR
jgi:hypothetical protein